MRAYCNKINVSIIISQHAAIVQKRCTMLCIIATKIYRVCDAEVSPGLCCSRSSSPTVCNRKSSRRVAESHGIASRCQSCLACSTITYCQCPGHVAYIGTEIETVIISAIKASKSLLYCARHSQIPFQGKCLDFIPGRTFI